MSMKQMIMRAQKHASRAAKHVVNHVRKHKRSYLFGIFGSFAIVRTFLLLAGFFGTLTITNTFAAETVVTSGNIVSDFGCDLDATTCDMSYRGIIAIEQDAFANHTALKNLYLDGNQLTGIDVSILTGLTDLRLNTNQLTTINLSGLSSLTHLDLLDNQLTEIDVSTLTGLTALRIHRNHLTEIDLSGLTSLTTLSLGENQLTEIDVSTLTNLTDLYLLDNQLTEIDVSALTGLTALNLGRNLLTTIDVSTLTSLTNLYLYDNQLTEIDLSGLTNITTLSLSNNQLTDIDLSGLSGLTILYLHSNQLTTIDLSLLSSLTELYLSSNQFTTIDVSMLTGLTSLGLSDNQLTNINLSGLSGLSSLNVGYNQLSSIDLSGLSGLTSLHLSNNQLSSIDLVGLSGLKSLYLSNNNLSGSLDVFCSLTGAHSIYLDHNNFDGQIPECFTIFGSLSRLTLNHNYLDITAGYSSELMDVLLNTTDDDRFYSWKHQYLPAEISLTGILTPLSGNDFVVTLGYYNSGSLSIHSGTIYYDMIDNLSLVSSIIYTTGTLQQQYGVFGDPCFDQFYTNSTGPYLDLLNQRAQNYAGMTFFEVLRDSHDLRYTGPESEGGKYFVDIFLDGLTDRGAIDIQDMDDMFLELGIDFSSAPSCGTPAKDVYIFDLGSIPAGSGGSLIITGSISPDIDNYSFTNTLYLFEPYNLRIDTATGDNTRLFPYTLSSNQEPDPETPVDDPITPTTTTTSNGGGITLHQDICTPNRDCSSSYYDNICGVCPTTGEVHNSASTQCSAYSDELNDAYTFAFENGITSIAPCTSARLETNITRRQLAKMITEFTIKTLKKQPNTKLPCTFEDTSKESGETKFYIKTACQLGLMGRSSDGTTTKKHFDPQDNVDRAQFGTILSRLLYGSTYNTKNATLRYTQHMKALKDSGIITNITTPFQKEKRGYIMLMLMRATNK